MNLPNQLTTSRILMTFALLGVMFSGLAYRESIALVLFVIAGFTDYLDGQIARKRQLITNFGILMDPLADKVLICSVFIAFVELRQMAAWMVIVIVARELAITGLRLLAASKNVVLAAEGLGKHKTASQMVSITAVLISMSYPQWGDWARAVFEQPILWGPWAAWFTELSKWVAVILTLWSGTFYLWRNREIYLRDS
jgi:CDP-diacylglycerol--glycerol-3-phosphate 3-phosphatidyltransferase